MLSGVRERQLSVLGSEMLEVEVTEKMQLLVITRPGKITEVASEVG